MKSIFNQIKNYGVKDCKTGDIIIEPKYVAVFMPCEGIRVAINEELKYGALDLNGNVIYPFKYDFILNKKDGICVAGIISKPIKEKKEYDKVFKKQFSKHYNPYESWIDNVRLHLYWANKKLFFITILGAEEKYDKSFIEETIKKIKEEKEEKKENNIEKIDNITNYDSIQDFPFERVNKEVIFSDVNINYRIVKNEKIRFGPYKLSLKWIGDSIFQIRTNDLFKRNKKGDFYRLIPSWFFKITYLGNGLFDAVLNEYNNKMHFIFNSDGELIFDRLADFSYDSNGLLSMVKEELDFSYPSILDLGIESYLRKVPSIKIYQSYKFNLSQFSSSKIIIYQTSSKKIKETPYIDIYNERGSIYTFKCKNNFKNIFSEGGTLKGIATYDSNEMIIAHDIRFLQLHLVSKDLFIGELENGDYVKYNYKTRDTITLEKWTPSNYLKPQMILDNKYIGQLTSERYYFSTNYINLEAVRDINTGESFLPIPENKRKEAPFCYLGDDLFLSIEKISQYAKYNSSSFNIKLYDHRKQKYLDDFYCNNLTKTGVNGIYRVFRYNKNGTDMYIEYMNRNGEVLFPKRLFIDFEYKKRPFTNDISKAGEGEASENTTSNFSSSFFNGANSIRNFFEK